MKETEISPSIMSIEQTLFTLTERINLSHKPVLVISDLDGTLADTHFYDHDLNVHTPIINSDLALDTCRLSVPLLVATGRPDNDPTVKQVWKQLSRPPMPIIGENGGVIIDPSDNSIIPAINSKELIALTETLSNLPDIVSLLHQRLIVPNIHEILIDNTRKTSIEIRIQDKISKVGSPLIHQESANFLRKNIISNHLVIVCSDSSVSIHPLSISKGNAVHHVISSLALDRSELFIVALGDADNDRSLFEMADIGIGVGMSTIGKSEITCLGGEKTSREVIKAISKLHI